MSLVWFEGKISRGGAIGVSPVNRGLALGDGLFETLLVVDGKALWKKEHLQRMAASAAALGIVFPQQIIEDAVTELEQASGNGFHILRLTMTRGATARGLGDDGGAPVVLATSIPFDARLIGQPARLVTTTLCRNPKSFASNHKTLSYVDSIVAVRQAEAQGGDGALMLNTSGFVASAAIGNVFLIKGDVLVTPARDQGILPGVIRSAVLQFAAGLGLRSNERAVERHELFTADCVFQTNSLRLVTPVSRIDDKVTGQRDCSFVLKAIVQEAQQRFGVNISIGGLS